MRASHEPTAASYHAADRLIAEVVSADRQRAYRRHERRMDAALGVAVLVGMVIYYAAVG